MNTADAVPVTPAQDTYTVRIPILITTSLSYQEDSTSFLDIEVPADGPNDAALKVERAIAELVRK